MSVNFGSPNSARSQVFGDDSFHRASLKPTRGKHKGQWLGIGRSQTWILSLHTHIYTHTYIQYRYTYTYTYIYMYIIIYIYIYTNISNWWAMAVLVGNMILNPVVPNPHDHTWPYMTMSSWQGAATTPLESTWFLVFGCVMCVESTYRFTQKFPSGQSENTMDFPRIWAAPNGFLWK